jgi:sigma-B regulation protein RsbU (phosphoserine phosphatase)
LVYLSKLKSDLSPEACALYPILSMAKLALTIFGLTISSPAEFLEYLNSYLYNKTADHFLTCFYGIVDPVKRKLFYANAGHPPFLHVRENSVTKYSAKGALIGVFENINLVEMSLELMQNDRIIFYTDGITEAHNIENEEFGENRLSDITLESSHFSLHDQLDYIMEEVFGFQSNEKWQDDVTLVGLQIINPS